MTKVALALSALSRLPLWVGYVLAGRECGDNAVHARAAVSWLLKSQSVTGNGGFAHSLHFARGWLPAYPETTGYILPTLFLAGRHYGVSSVDDAIARAWHWLQSIQRQDGSFPDLDGLPQVFDTGQILVGANFLGRQRVPGARAVAEKSCAWLVQQQSPDGGFVTHAYHSQPHAYYSRVGAALVEAGHLLDRPSVFEAGMRNLEWTLRQQSPDGWFQQMSFADHAPYSHTIVYTLEGLLAGYRFTHDRRMLDAVVLCASRLRDRIHEHGGVVRSQYADGFSPLDDEICTTGLCQWAALCFRLGRLGVDGFREEAEKSLAAAKRLQLHSALSMLDGGMPGSVPLSGRYMRFALPNWGAKFFLDALLEADGVNDLPPLI